MKKPPLKPLKKTKPVQRRVEGKKRAAATTTAPRAKPKLSPIAAVGREIDNRGRPMGLFQIMAKAAEFLGAAFVLAINTPQEAIRTAGGSLIDAMNGHTCGPACYHAPPGTPAEKQAWWDKKLADYDKRRETARCRAVHQAGVLTQGERGGSDGVRCVHTIGHTGAHQDERWRDGKPGGVAWWT